MQALRLVGPFSVVACLVFAASWSSESRAQWNTPAPAHRAPAEPRPPVKHPAAVQAAPSAATPAVTQVAMPLGNPNSPLGNAISHQCAISNEPSDFVLPGAKGDIKVDRCSRGRDQLSCEFNVLAVEAKSLRENYRTIAETNYPEIQDMRGMCSIQTETLANDRQKATEFLERFRQLKTEYAARSGCARKVSQSLKEITLNDLSQAPNLLKSIIDNVEAEVKAVSDAEGQVSEFAERIASSQRAMGTLQKVHRVVCTTALPKAEVSR
jgi:hypothetical protein